MELRAMKCPNCSGDIKYTPGKAKAVCPYCDSQIQISMTAEEREFERDTSRLAHNRDKYFKDLKIWRVIFYISLPLAVLSGVLLSLSDSAFLGLPAIFFIFAASPVLRLAAPDIPKDLEGELSKKERPLKKGALYGIFIGLVLLGGVVTGLIKDDSKPEEGTASSSAVSQADS
ncbi:TFIIB-type zinc ribbon-containing protein [Ruminococcus albus]|nr:TFIIB-type zinc ribbon-containing protein [Ruminococcus albus]